MSKHPGSTKLVQSTTTPAHPTNATTPSAQSSTQAKQLRFSADFKQFLTILHDRGPLEIRALSRAPGSEGGRAKCWRFDNVADAVDCIGALDSRDDLSGVYTTLNPLCPESDNGASRRPAKDVDIASRRWLFVDVDPKRPPKTNATEPERNAAFELARKVGAHLSRLGWPEPIMGNSGNGFYLLYRIDLPNDGSSLQVVKQVLTTLSDRFKSDGAEVDSKNSNAARLIRVLGTLNRKGDGSDLARPCCRSSFLAPRKPLQIVTIQQLLAVGAAGSQPSAGAKSSKLGQTNAVQPRTAQADRVESVQWYARMLDNANVGYQQFGSGESATLAMDCPVCDAPAARRKCTVKQGTSRLVIACGKCNASGDRLRDAMQAKRIPWVGSTEASPSADDDDLALQIRDAVYSLILERLELSPAHRENLRSRGFSNSDIEQLNIRSVPAATCDQEKVKNDISDLISAVFRGNAVSKKLEKHFEKIPGIRKVNGIHTIQGLNQGCMLIPIRNQEGQVTRLRCRLDKSDGQGKYNYLGSEASSVSPSSTVHVPEPTLTLLNQSKGSRVITIAEGELKAEFVARVMARPAISMPGCAAYNAALKRAQELMCTTIDWAFDADHCSNPSVARNLVKAVASCTQIGQHCRLVLWDETYKGIDDVPTDDTKLIWTLDGPALMDYIDRLAAKHAVENIDRRRRVTIAAGEDLRVVEDILDTMSANGYYRMPGDSIARFNVSRGVFDHFNAESLSAQIDRFAVFQRPAAGAKPALCKLPTELARKAYYRTDYTGLRRISATLDGPGILQGGRLLLRKGFDTDSGVFVLREPAGWNPSARELTKPTKQQAMTAYTNLAELFVDYNFADRSGPAILVAAMLSIVGRLYINGNVPIFAITAQQPRAGKTLAAEVVTSIACGEPAPMTAMVRDDSQFRSEITALMMNGRQVVVYDNVADGRTIATPILAELVTSKFWRDRPLRTNCDFMSQNNLTILITGNRLTFSRELARRTIAVNLGKQLRSEFKHGELSTYARANRSKLLLDLLTIWSWIVENANSLSAKPTEIASFREFTSLIAAPILEFSGVDLGGHLCEESPVYDADVSQSIEVLDAIATLRRRTSHVPRGSNWWKAADLTQDLVRASNSRGGASDAEIAAAVTINEFIGCDKKGASYLGRRLAGLVGQSYGDWTLRSRSERNTNMYMLEFAAKAME